MNQKTNLMVLARFHYVNPRTKEEYNVVRGWPCKDQTDAENIVKYYGMKTGSYSAECNLEEFTNEEIKQIKTNTTTKEAHQA